MKVKTGFSFLCPRYCSVLRPPNRLADLYLPGVSKGAQKEAQQRVISIGLAELSCACIFFHRVATVAVGLGSVIRGKAGNTSGPFEMTSVTSPMAFSHWRSSFDQGTGDATRSPERGRPNLASAKREGDATRSPQRRAVIARRLSRTRTWVRMWSTPRSAPLFAVAPGLPSPQGSVVVLRCGRFSQPRSGGWWLPSVATGRVPSRMGRGSLAACL